MNKMHIKYIYLVLLFLLTIGIWWNLYSSQFLEYDENWGVIITVFLLSIVATLVLIAIWFKARVFIKQNSLVTIVFLILNSPLTIGVIIYNYQDIFGHLKL